MPPQSPSESGNESDAVDTKNPATDNSDNEDDDSEDEEVPAPVPMTESPAPQKRKVPLPEPSETKKKAKPPQPPPPEKKKAVPKKMNSDSDDDSEGEPVRAMAVQRPKVVEEPIDAVADAEQARQQVAAAPAAAPAAAAVTESYVDPKIVEDCTFVQVSANGLMAAILPNSDIVHAVGKRDPALPGDDPDWALDPFEVTKEVTKGIASNKLAAQRAMLEESMTRVLRSVIIFKVKSKDPANKHQNVQFCLPIKIIDGDSISASIDEQINSKAPEGHCKLWPLEPKTVADMYKQTRNKLPSKYMPSDTVKAVVIKNVESQADIDSTWVIVAKSTSRASSSGTKRAAAAADKPSKKKAANDDDASSSPPPPVKKPKTTGQQQLSVHEMLTGGAASSTTTEPTTNGHVEDSSSTTKIDLDALPILHPGMPGTRVAMFELSSAADVSVVRVAGNKVVLAFSK